MLFVLFLAACASSDYTALYAHQPTPPSLTGDDLRTLDYMGPVLIEDGVNFCVWSENAEYIEVAFFDDPESTQPVKQIAMEDLGEGIWNVYVEGVGVGQHYGYIAWGPNWTHDEEFVPYTDIGFQSDVDEDGNRFNPNKLLTDPWSKVIHRGHDWSKGSAASGPDRTVSTYAAASKSMVSEMDDPDYSYEWSEEEQEWWEARQEGGPEGHAYEDLIIYETHVKGFTANTASGVDHPGTYRGFGQKASYLADLGITAVELLPVHEKDDSLGGYWGYSTVSFFAPELDYADAWLNQGEPREVADEFRAMVEALHAEGIEVILDVVYNHTGEGGLWETKVCAGGDPEPVEEGGDCYEFPLTEVATIFSMRGLDNASYYAVTEDGQNFVDHTGVGHDTRANYTPFRRLVMDSLHFWVEEMHVDGFRFDLAAILGEGADDPYTWDPYTSLLQDIVDDPVLQANNTRIIAESWAGLGGYDNYGQLIGKYPTSSNADSDLAWAEWNGAFRDWWRRFINWDYALSSMEYGGDGTCDDEDECITGWETWYGTPQFFDDGRSPYHSVNYITIHDGFTLYDLFSFDNSRNACGPLNPVCCYDPYSVWCDLHDPYSQSEGNYGVEPLKRQLMRNLQVATLLANGTPILLGGDEWLRTQYGNNNAYSDGADNAYNWYRWGEWTNNIAYERHRMYDFVQQMIALRKKYASAFAPAEYGVTDAASAWKNADNEDLSGGEWDGDQVMIHYYGVDPQLAVLVNMEPYSQTFTLPEGVTWAALVDTGMWWDVNAGYTWTDFDDELSYAEDYWEDAADILEASGYPVRDENLENRGSEPGGYFKDYPDADPYRSANIWLDEPRDPGLDSYGVSPYSIVVLVEE